VYFFGFDFCWESVAVPALREKDVVVSHVFVVGFGFDVCPVEDVSHVKVVLGIWRRSVDSEGVAGVNCSVEFVDAHRFPVFLLLLLN
jgi:hypothetical protein